MLTQCEFLKDETGNRYGRLVVIKRVCNSKSRSAKWLCRCDCGNETTPNGFQLRNGQTKSCGCLRKELASKRIIKTMADGIRRKPYKEYKYKTHRMSNSPEYLSWSSMKERCSNPNVISYKNYGARGIIVCDSWMKSFNNFYKDMGGRPTGASLDRIDNNGNYCSDNCKWSSKKQQQNNRRSNNLIKYNGKEHTLMEWSEMLGIKYGTLSSRIVRLHWTPKMAFETPPRPLSLTASPKNV